MDAQVSACATPCHPSKPTNNRLALLFPSLLAPYLFRRTGRMAMTPKIGFTGVQNRNTGYQAALSVGGSPGDFGRVVSPDLLQLCPSSPASIIT